LKSINKIFDDFLVAYLIRSLCNISAYGNAYAYKLMNSFGNWLIGDH